MNMIWKKNKLEKYVFPDVNNLLLIFELIYCVYDVATQQFLIDVGFLLLYEWQRTNEYKFGGMYETVHFPNYNG